MVENQFKLFWPALLVQLENCANGSRFVLWLHSTKKVILIKDGNLMKVSTEKYEM